MLYCSLDDKIASLSEDSWSFWLRKDQMEKSTENVDKRPKVDKDYLHKDASPLKQYGLTGHSNFVDEHALPSKEADILTDWSHSAPTSDAVRINVDVTPSCQVFTGHCSAFDLMNWSLVRLAAECGSCASSSELKTAAKADKG